MLKLWKSGGHGGVDQQGEAKAEEGRTGVPKRRGRRPGSTNARKEIDPYLVLLLERIAYQTHNGTMTFEEYKTMVKKDATQQTSKV
jgi:hypothetical protein